MALLYTTKLKCKVHIFLLDCTPACVVILMAILSETDEDTIDLGTQASGESRGSGPICLAGRLCTSRPFNVYALIDVMLKGFKAKGKVSAREWDKSLLIFSFSDPDDREWVLQNQPWHFEGNLFAVTPLSGTEQPSSVRATLKTLARRIRTLEAFDPPANNLGSFLRFNIEVDIASPLKRGLTPTVPHDPANGNKVKRTWKRDARGQGELRLNQAENKEGSRTGKRVSDDREEMDVDVYSSELRELDFVARKLEFDFHLGVDCFTDRGGRRGDWRFTGIYGWPEDHHKWKTWRLLDTLAMGNTLPWLCLGDFNEILFQYEKQGGSIRRESRMEDFQNCLERNSLIDLGAGGDLFTWSNMQAGRANIRERLDRCLANSMWMDQFPGYKISNLLRVLSDHTPIEARWSSKTAAVQNCPRQKLFRFEEKWLQEEQCKEVILDSWGNDMTDSDNKLLSNIETCNKSLSAWGSAHFGDLKDRIEATSKELAKLQILPATHDRLQRVRSLENKLAALLRKEELHWLQHPRVSWIRDGDKNTNFFHRTASGRRSRNRIVKITDGDGLIWEDAEEMEWVFTEYFTGLFTTQGELDLREVVNSLEVPPKLQVFMWRCYKNILPVCSNLVGRFVDVEPLCKRCGTEVETMEHALRDCEWTSNYWASSSIQSDIGALPSADIALGSWITSMAQNLTREKQCTFISLLWGAWWARNTLYFEDKKLDTGFIHMMVRGLVDDYKRANACTGRINNSTQIPEQLIWRPPDPGFVNVNTDASVGSGGGTIGGIARDEQGLALWCFAEKTEGEMDVETVEALAVLRACTIAVEQHVTKLEVEMDSQILLKALKFPKPNISFFGIVIGDILSLCSFFERIKFCWIRRLGNSVAHSLASLARSLDDPLFSPVLSPSCMNEYYADLQNY
ncbi:hypothetical protein ACS0TY_032782 [Phlomoides rotata]